MHRQANVVRDCKQQARMWQQSSLFLTIIYFLVNDVLLLSTQSAAEK